MYYPYIRGKQNELIMLRENAELIADSNIHPILEPVKSNLNPLVKTLHSLLSEDCEFSIIINPKCGNLQENLSLLINELTEEEILSHKNVSIALILDEEISLKEIKDYLESYQNEKITLIHYGFSQSKSLRSLLKEFNISFTHIFIEEFAQKRYRKAFEDDIRVLVRDGFKKRPNREHPYKEHFSELHIMYEDEGMDGFGDFLINGDEYSESGGPAYAVAIHLTYINEDDDDDMLIKHYVSDRKDSPANPGGKFLEALEKLVSDDDPHIFHSHAHREFKKLAERQHFPGLGYVKKLSMQHHVELIADFLR
ncbi:sce7725 family protein [Pseudoalteromonas maricaloris]